MERWSFVPASVPSAATVKHTASTVVTADGRSGSASPQLEPIVKLANYLARFRTPVTASVGAFPSDAFMSVKIGTLLEFQLYMVWWQLLHFA